jgi:hypothetical protein
MNKIGILGAVLAIVAVVGLIWISYSGMQKSPTGVAKVDYKNATYTMDGSAFTLVNGVAELPTPPGAASTITIKYFGNDATGDLNGDGITDRAFLLTQQGGGSGTFYYVVASLQNSAGGYVGTNAVLLGDRIAPQSTAIKDAEVIVNYADRKVGEPMTTKPSVGVTKYFSVANGQLMPSSQSSQ